MTAHRLNTQVASLLRDVSLRLILPAYRNLARHDIVMKAPGEVVTCVDREVEAELTSALRAMLPHALVIGEEACAANPALLGLLDAEQLWIVDPIDGTANFVEGHPPFGIIVALCEGGVTQAAWLYDPLVDRLCHAVRGGGAWIDGAQVQTSARAGVRPVAALATQFMEPAARAAFATRAAEAFELVPIPRCAAEHYPRVVTGQNDVAMFQRTLPWDHAAGVLFLTEAGGYVARWDGTPYDFRDDRRGLLAAASPELWQHAAAILFEDAVVPELQPQHFVIPPSSFA